MERVITEFKTILVKKSQNFWEHLLIKEGREGWELAAIVDETSHNMRLVLQRKMVV